MGLAYTQQQWLLNRILLHNISSTDLRRLRFNVLVVGDLSSTLLQAKHLPWKDVCEDMKRFRKFNELELVIEDGEQDSEVWQNIRGALEKALRAIGLEGVKLVRRYDTLL